MKEFLKPLVSASNKVSKKGNINKPEELKKIVKDLNEDYDCDIDEIEGVEFIEEPKDKKEKKGKAGGTGSINESIKAIVKEKTLILDDETEVEITYLEKDSPRNIQAPFDYIFSEASEFDEDRSELQVITFKDHPLWEKKVDNDVIKILATYDAIYRVLVEKLGYETSDALKIRNQWMASRTGKEN